MCTKKSGVVREALDFCFRNEIFFKWDIFPKTQFGLKATLNFDVHAQCYIQLVYWAPLCIALTIFDQKIASGKGRSR